MWKYFFRVRFSPLASSEALNSGNFFSAAALKKFPEFNASLDASGENLTLKKYFHIGFAADTPNGLVVPVIRDVDKKGVVQIAQETGELAKKARDGKLGPADMSGGC
ncbi:2-oxo acid dehydrogenase subunit E2, partial [Stenotrophomonas maltophilia]|uniref:2-oxo acid dehydrogenase subunit E2 n=1 Tax=Stenotrophomonas maltophilia TaxID=40324 RepID=UPI003D18974A